MKTKCPVCLSPPPRGEQRCAEQDLYCVEPADIEHRANAPLLGRTLLDRYLLVGWLGGAGDSVVYRAFDTHLRRTVALRLLAPDRLAATDARVRFQREARALADFEHPGAARLLDYGALPGGVVRGSGYLVMERVRGLGLDQRMALGPVAVEQALRFLETIASVLERVHALGTGHLDLRPANVRLVPDDDGHIVPVLVGFAVGDVPADPAALTDTCALAALVAEAVGPAAPAAVQRALTAGVDGAHATPDALRAAVAAAARQPERPVPVAEPTQPPRAASPSQTEPPKPRRALGWVLALLLLVAGGVGAAFLLIPEEEAPPPSADDDVVRVKIPMGGAP